MSFGDGFASGASMVSKYKSKSRDKGEWVEPGTYGSGDAPAREASPMDKTKTWLKDKFNELTAGSSAAADMADAPKGGEDVGLMERLKAGNIDDPKSEAYARWGKGKGATVAPTGDASQVSDPEALGPGGTFTSAMWDEAPESGSGANPAWDDLNKNMEA